MFKSSKLHFWTLEILLIALILYVSTKITFLFEPLVVFGTTLFFPIIISGFLYFLLNPIVNKIQMLKVPRTVAILLIYLLMIGLITLVILLIAPIFTKQVTQLVEDIPTYAKQTKELIDEVSTTEEYKWVVKQDYVTIDDIEKAVSDIANTLPDRLTNGISTVIGWVTSTTITIVTVPFLLFYMFKDGHRFPHALARFIPSKYKQEGLKIIKDTNKTLAAYIQGQVIVATFVGTLAYIGYLIIDLPYALIMAMIVVVTNIIPYVGPILGGAPAVIIALFNSPTQAFLVIVVITIAQQIEGNVLSPLILGKTLDTHPATIIILLLVAGNLAGVLGMILAIPVYAVLKTLVLNVVRFLKVRKSYLDKEEIEV
ncbi:putative PurR-regulated permease PerM [Bacillus pakistanensis]|uniref:PurR-regulated permease PerM n=1 Tax=Rossellomorea pakistanensis TaxID=992288 RepID=A0ABS2NCA8_9BACI|nr:AI-2E family transporter [Bacillus pakistanensis]MBM7585502.1 putative PurR-regulated permease PerM [Bacillus pakistanensis]